MGYDCSSENINVFKKFFFWGCGFDGVGCGLWVGMIWRGIRKGMVFLKCGWVVDDIFYWYLYCM